MLIDTHSHIYDEAFDADRQEVVERAKAEGVERIVLPAIDGESNERLFDMCREYGDYVVPLMGLHPTSVNDNPRWREELAEVERLLKACNGGASSAPIGSPERPVERFWGVGEVGLDFYWSKEFYEEQMQAFRNAPLQGGEKVRVKENGMVGEVTKVSAKAVVVVIGNISSKMPLDKVERITSNEFKSAVKETARPVSTIKYDSSISERKLNFSTEMDVRGERLNDAVEKVTRYVDDAVMLGVPSVRIIHGKGTGVLRDELQKLIRTIPGVASVKDEHIQFGGTGVTIVTFD